QALTLAAEVPQRRIDSGERERRDRSDGRCVGGEFEFAPERFDAVRILPDEPWNEMIGEEAHDRRSAGPDRIGIAGPGCAVAVSDRNDRRFLLDEALDRVGALHLWRNVDQPQLDPFDFRHSSPSRSDRPPILAEEMRLGEIERDADGPPRRERRWI